MEKLAKQILNLPKPPKWSWPEDWLAKAISLLFAVFLWYFVSGEDRVDMNVEIPVEIINLPRDLVISNQFKNQLNVTVSGAKGIIRGIDRQHVTRTIDLSQAVPGNMIISNELDSIPFPRGIQTLRIQPSSITMLLDRLIQKDIPIQHVITGSIPSDYELVSVTVDPASLSVSGPEAILGEISTLKTKEIDISNITKSTVKQVALSVTEELANLTGDPIVSATFTIKQKVKTIELSDVHLLVKGVQEGFYAQPSPNHISVKIEIPFTLAKQTTDLSKILSAVVQIKSSTPGKYLSPVTVTPTKGVNITNYTPTEVQVELWEKKSKKRFN